MKRLKKAIKTLKGIDKLARALEDISDRHGVAAVRNLNALLHKVLSMEGRQ
jgi:hypothetical protein